MKAEAKVLEPKPRLPKRIRIITAIAIAMGLVITGRVLFKTIGSSGSLSKGEVEALCQSVLDPENSAEQRCHDADLLRPCAGEKSGSWATRNLAQLTEGAHILANWSGLHGELLDAYLSQAGLYFTQASRSWNSQVGAAAKKGLLLIPTLRSSKDGSNPTDVFASLELGGLFPKKALTFQVSSAASAPLNEDSHKYLVPKAAGQDSKDEPAETTTEAPSFSGVGAKELITELNARFGMRFTEIGAILKPRYAPPLRGLNLFESKEHPLTGLSGDAVTQDDALLQIAVSVKLSGNPRDDAPALALFRSVIELLEQAKSSHYADWAMDKARVALIEPDRPFAAKMSDDATLVSLRYRQALGGFTRPSLTVDFEEKIYFQWFMGQLPQEAPVPANRK